MRAESPEEVDVEGLEIEPIEEAIELGHAGAIARQLRGSAARWSRVSDGHLQPFGCISIFRY